MKNCLVTGAAGFLGFHISRFLLAKANRLTLCDNFSRGVRDQEFEELCRQKDVAFLELDLTDRGEFRKLKGTYDEVYHMAAINGTRFFYEKPDEVLRVNLLSTIHLLDWFAASGSKRLLFPSSSEAYAGTISRQGGPFPTPETVPLSVPDVFNPRFSYAGSKIAGELLVVNYGRRFGFEFHIVRYHNIYGPRMGTEHVIPELIRRVLRREDPLKIYGAKQRRAFCYVDDACQATVELMHRGVLAGEIVHVGNPSAEIAIGELAEKICQIAGWKPEFEIHPPPEGSVERRLPDIAKLEKGLSFKPKMGLTAGLAKTYEWFSRKG